MPKITPALALTIVFLLIEVALILLCRWKLKQPANPARPRLMPYGTIILVLFITAMATAAHTVSLVTGHTLAPRIRQSPAQGGKY